MHKDHRRYLIHSSAICIPEIKREFSARKYLMPLELYRWKHLCHLLDSGTTVQQLISRTGFSENQIEEIYFGNKLDTHAISTCFFALNNSIVGQYYE